MFEISEAQPVLGQLDIPEFNSLDDVMSFVSTPEFDEPFSNKRKAVIIAYTKERWFDGAYSDFIMWCKQYFKMTKSRADKNAKAGDFLIRYKHLYNSHFKECDIKKILIISQLDSFQEKTGKKVLDMFLDQWQGDELGFESSEYIKKVVDKYINPDDKNVDFDQAKDDDEAKPNNPVTQEIEIARLITDFQKAGMRIFDRMPDMNELQITDILALFKAGYDMLKPYITPEINATADQMLGK